jgi:starch phosphorylase
MLRDYVTRLYHPAQSQRRKLEANGGDQARQLADWKRHVRSAWPGVRMELMLQSPAHLHYDDKIRLHVRAHLNGLRAQDVKLECLFGRDPDQEETGILQVAHLECVGGENDSTEFEAEVTPEVAGMQYYRLRMYPCNEAMSHPFELGCMIWI